LRRGETRGERGRFAGFRLAKKKIRVRQALMDLINSGLGAEISTAAGAEFGQRGADPFNLAALLGRGTSATRPAPLKRGFNGGLDA